MHISNFIKGFKNHPVLFIGTGLTLRYLDNSYTWEDLLKKISLDVSDDNEKFLDIKSESFDGEKFSYPLMGTEIEKLVTKNLSENRYGNFSKINDQFYNEVEKGNSISRFKLLIADLFSDIKYREDMMDEIIEFKMVRKNISSVITTNYDNMIEELFKFKPLIGNDILLSNPYGSIYKIHGSISAPKDIIITSEDYKNFENKYELIRAQLLSLFIHHPIVFIGYSIQDENIKNILETIFTYVPHGSELAEKIRSNFLLVEYEKDSTNLEVTDCDIVLSNNKSIKINKIRTDDYSSIYKFINELVLPVSAMDIRKVQNIVQEIYTGGNITVKFTENLDDLQNSDKVLAIGSKKTIKYTHKDAKQIIEMYFSIIEERNEQLVELINDIKIQNNQYFPIFGFSKISLNINEIDKLKKQQVDKIESNVSKILLKFKIHHHSIFDILSDEKIPTSYKLINIYFNVYSNNISTDHVADFLKDYSDPKDSNYKKLLCLYDYKKYN